MESRSSLPLLEMGVRDRFEHCCAAVGSDLHVFEPLLTDVSFLRTGRRSGNTSLK